MTITEYQQKVDHWIKEYGIRYFDVLTNTILLQEEVGEFSGLVARIHGEQSFKEQLKQSNEKMLADELADILFVLVCLANQLDVDLERAIATNFLKKQGRDSERHLRNPKLG